MNKLISGKQSDGTPNIILYAHLWDVNRMSLVRLFESCITAMTSVSRWTPSMPCNSCITHSPLFRFWRCRIPSPDPNHRSTGQLGRANGQMSPLMTRGCSSKSSTRRPSTSCGIGRRLFEYFKQKSRKQDTTIYFSFKFARHTWQAR